MATRTDTIVLSGRIDRLDARPGLVVVDYKTGRHLLTVDDARSSLALALYALAASRVLRRPCHRVELHHLPTGQVNAIGEYLLTLPGSTRVLPGEGEETTIGAAEKHFDVWVAAGPS